MAQRAFEDIKLDWGGAAFVVRSDRVMGAIGRIEDVITLSEIYEMLERPKTTKLSKIAAAYGAVLRYAGAEVKDEEVYAGMFGGVEAAQAVKAAIMTLLWMMVPQSAIKEKGTVPRGKAAPAAPRSSRKRSR